MENALQAFRDAVLPQEPVALNNHHNIETLLLFADQSYYNKLHNFTGWPQRGIFWNNVIGFLQSLVTPEVAQVFCESIYYVAKKGKTLARMVDR